MGESSGAGPIGSDDVEHLRSKLTRAVARICPFWLAQEREDLVQTALLKIVGGHRTDKEPRQLSGAYLWKTAYSVTLDEIRRARWRFERPLEPNVSSPENPSPDQDPEESAASGQVFSQVRGCLEQLEPSRRRAVLLHLTGSSHAEAATLLGKHVKQVDNLIHRGMKSLRECLRSKGISR